MIGKLPKPNQLGSASWHSSLSSLAGTRQNLRLGRIFIAAGLVIGSLMTPILGSADAHATASLGSLTGGCDDLKIVFARGSGERLGDISFQAWQQELDTELKGANLNYSFYELGSSEQGGARYPAVSVSDGIGGFLNLAGAYIGSGAWFEFGHSVDTGVSELTNYIGAVAKICPGTKFVLGGYSQGAMVISRALLQIDAEKVIYAATFGDPKLYLPEGMSYMLGVIPKLPDACLGQNLSEYRAYVPDCKAYEGVLGSLRPYRPAEFYAKVGTWCNKADIMCSSGLSLDDHTSYVADNLYRDAAEKIYQKIRQAFRDKFTEAERAKRLLHDVAIVFDNTGSMQSDFSEYLSVASGLSEKVYRSGGRVALVEYGDLAEKPAKVTCDFSCSEEEMGTAIHAIQFDGGGDDPESALSASLTALNRLDWQNGATKSIMLITDNDAINPDRDGTTIEQVTRRSLEIDPVNIYTITKSSRLGVNETLAEQTSGRVFYFSDSAEVDIDAIFARPVAKLALPEYQGQIGDQFVFDASESYEASLTGLGEVGAANLGEADSASSGEAANPGAGSQLSFDWDLDGDGVFELKNAGAKVRKTYDRSFAGFIQVKVWDNNGYYSTMSAAITVESPEDFDGPATISSVAVEPLSADSVQIDMQTNASKVFLSVDDAPLGILEVEGGRAKVALLDVHKTIRVILTPIAASGQKGYNREMDITVSGYPGSWDAGYDYDSDPSAGNEQPTTGGSSPAPSRPGSSRPDTVTEEKVPEVALPPNSGSYTAAAE